mmetsp:Transcript_24823/g.64426  ORF Transcript_24823/g.64426 Transcript_24823/m.64426 type:complete len:87 (+) Transcript_24823:621-881(+)
MKSALAPSTGGSASSWTSGRRPARPGLSSSEAHPGTTASPRSLLTTTDIAPTEQILAEHGAAQKASYLAEKDGDDKRSGQNKPLLL